MSCKIFEVRYKEILINERFKMIVIASFFACLLLINYNFVPSKRAHVMRDSTRCADGGAVIYKPSRYFQYEY